MKKEFKEELVKEFKKYIKEECEFKDKEKEDVMNKFIDIYFKQNSQVHKMLLVSGFEMTLKSMLQYLELQINAINESENNEK